MFETESDVNWGGKKSERGAEMKMARKMIDMIETIILLIFKKPSASLSPQNKHIQVDLDHYQTLLSSQNFIGKFLLFNINAPRFPVPGDPAERYCEIYTKSGQKYAKQQINKTVRTCVLASPK